MNVEAIATSVGRAALDLLAEEQTPIGAELVQEAHELATDAATFALLDLAGADTDSAYAGLKARALNLKSAGRSLLVARVLGAVHQFVNGRADASLRRALELI